MSRRGTGEPRAAQAPPVFVDTGFLIGLLDADDAFHAAALRRGREVAGRPRVTTTAVLVEAGDGFSDHGTWSDFAAFLARLRADPTVTVVPVDESLVVLAAALRDANLARKWGLTDCISFVVMKKRGITEARAADKHFREAGFDALLLDP